MHESCPHGDVRFGLSICWTLAPHIGVSGPKPEDQREPDWAVLDEGKNGCLDMRWAERMERTR